MIRINADEHFAFAQCRLCVVPITIGKQRCERRLKKIISFHLSKISFNTNR